MEDTEVCKEVKKAMRREQLRQAQKRWREKVKASTQALPREEPKCYTKEYRVSYHKAYYARKKLEKQTKDKILYTHCAVGYRSLRAAKILKKYGYEVRALKPGYEELVKAGFESEKEPPKN